MDYIVLDFEWNQPGSAAETIAVPFPFDSEIIEIGAIRLNDSFETVDEFKAYVKPTFYPILNGSVCRLTGIRPTMLKQAETFPEVYRTFKDWCGDEFSFITWSETDIPVLMDNLLMHGMPLDDIPVCYDLQRIFGCEILRNDSQCALENAMDMLRLPKAKAHDALNDVRNTVKIADFLDLPALIEHYETRYINYGEDRLSDVFGHKPYPSTSEAIDDESIVTFNCPCCDERLKADAFVFSRSGKPIGTATCSNDTSYFIRIGGTRIDRQSIVISRRIFRMNDDLQDIYDEAAEDME